MINKLSMFFVIFCIVLIFVFLPKINNKQSNITIVRNNQIYVSPETKNIGLIGCTPHPTKYVTDHAYYPGIFKNRSLSEFIDLDDLKDSYRRLFRVCLEQKIDHLVIAFLPIYFFNLKALIGTRVTEATEEFFMCMVPQLCSLIKTIAHESGYHHSITISIPPRNLFEYIPTSVRSKEEYAYYLIKQFPRLCNLKKSETPTITIINNINSDEQNRIIIELLQYDYLYTARLEFQTATIGKERFHLYI